MNVEEKILLLGGLFHDVGKFQQRCENVRRTHEVLGSEFAFALKEPFVKILGSEIYFNRFVDIIKEHHNKKAVDLTHLCLNADHLSASEREEPDYNENGRIIWGHRFLASVLGKVGLLNSEPNIMYCAQNILSPEKYKAIIPSVKDERDFGYPEKIFNNFATNIEAVLKFYTEERDFPTLVNLLLKVIEKYMWCVPDFTGSSITDISLYNHLKDTAGFSHALYKSSGDELNLLIGDIPGIQNYIFNLVNKKTPKMLRGRSIFVQIMSRVFASIMLRQFGLTDANLIMLAGGKFYIIIPEAEDTLQKIEEGTNAIYKMLENNYEMELKYVYGVQKFNYTELRDKKISFGDIIEKASADLDANKKIVFKDFRFFKDRKVNETGFQLNFEFDEVDSVVTKDEVTGKPINKSKIEDIASSRQTKMEYKIGDSIVRSNLLVEFTEDYSEIIGEPKKLDENYKYSVNPKILLNPNLEELLKIKNLKGNILRDMVFIDAASYCTLKENQVLDFDTMAQTSSGAKYLTLIKGDIDNLGLLMAYGLAGDNKDLTSVSRTTTMSSHLKYFFSVFLNKFLEDWEKKSPEGIERPVYTVFAGGDDLMLIAPQSTALELLNEFNCCFNEFVCNNPEIHVTYSLTNFHPKTPLKIVNELSEENQEAAKQAGGSKIDLDDAKAFYRENNKACTLLHNTNIKNEQLDYIIKNKKVLIQLIDSDNKFTRSILRKLFELMEIKKYNKSEIKNTEGRWHPLLNYLVNRILKNRKNEYENKETEKLFDALLKMNQKEFSMFSMTIYPLLNEVIYSIRNERTINE